MGKLIIAMGRQFDTGGHLVGEKIAERLGLKFYDGEMIDDIAKKGGLENYEYTGVPAPNHSFKGHYEWMPTQEEFEAHCKVIKDLAERGNCVICGRCADWLLRDDPNCVRVFIRADFDYRVQRFIKAYNITDVEGIEDRYKVLDEGRAAYYKHFTGREWGQLDDFNLVIDTTVCGPQRADEILYAYLKLCNLAE